MKNARHAAAFADIHPRRHLISVSPGALDGLRRRIFRVFIERLAVEHGGQGIAEIGFEAETGLARLPGESFVGFRRQAEGNGNGIVFGVWHHGEEPFSNVLAYLGIWNGKR